MTTPAAHLGRPVGGDFTLADWGEVSSYFRKLDAESDRVTTLTVGKTTEGRDFLLTLVSSKENLANLDGIKAQARTLADPRGKSDEQKREAVEKGRVIVFISCAMHATETAAPQMAMELAYELATHDDERWNSIRESLVIAIIPSTNPDGQDHVCEWYRKTVGTPYEASDLLKLYQYYSGHDNNRDWFMMTQAETRLVTKLLYTEWFPTVYWDVHQQGTREERMFVPPFRDPLNPNLDPAVIAGINLLGTRAVMDLTRKGFTGISTGVSYDMWWNGGNRNVPVRHNIVGLLTEAASVRLATPMFLPRTELSAPGGGGGITGGYRASNQFVAPWPGGWWRIRDIIDYELAFARSLLTSLSRERRYWLSNSLEASERAIKTGSEEAPRAWLIPSDNRDPAGVRRLLEAVILAGVEVHVSSGPVTADGREYPAGTVVIRREQPYGTHVKDLFEVQRYPDGPPPYDVAGWTLPLLMGVRRVEVMESFEADLKPARTPEEATAGFAGDARAKGGATSSWHSDAWTGVAAALQAGKRLWFVHGGTQAGLFISAEPGKDAVVMPLESMPRIGLYSPWSGSMDEGWMRYALDTEKIPYVSVRNEMLRAGSLSSFLDVLIIPDIGAGTLDNGRTPGSIPERYAGGLAPEGAVAVEEFVRTGGRLITLGSASQWAIDLFELPLIDVARGSEAKEFSCPGSVVRGIPEAHAGGLTVGLADSLGVFFSRSSAYRELTGEEKTKAGLTGAREIAVLLRYAPTRVLLSGWIKSPEVIEGKGAWIRARHGDGAVHLFGFSPQYRGWSQGTYQLVYRAAILDRPPPPPNAPPTPAPVKPGK